MPATELARCAPASGSATSMLPSASQPTPMMAPPRPNSASAPSPDNTGNHANRGCSHSVAKAARTMARLRDTLLEAQLSPHCVVSLILQRLPKEPHHFLGADAMRGRVDHRPVVDP